ncbi:hypothetical protein NMF83_14525 [Clostridioides difficile]|uniref:hypothetical protein n=2 Tax=Clostridioides difficile TaxID=1496 RepID=UPI0020305841|nr:hypothetical protein [Clostridioides difficile]MCM0736383.1 hypothetical protein [Clostridioides difficile]MCM0744218.1 hypothetical protein [Clostridioides difficile]MCP8338256.1 hypothetical protein [Clostridioides difficile]MCP8367517.1 hypothetical protein [Clostridioides difficile]MCP8383921.1 hypothetical protein [Clostridioides difficile]
MNALQSELLKYKRTFMGKLIVFFPVSFAAYAFIMQSTLMQNPLSQTTSWAWQNLLALIFNWWSFLFLPIGFALFATLVAFQEKKLEIIVLYVHTMCLLWHFGLIKL